MLNSQYTADIKNVDDERVLRIMRARTIQEAINYVGITDPPRNMEEYKQASQIFRLHIQRYQPDISNHAISIEDSTKVKYDGNPIVAREAIYQWAYVALLGVALRTDFQETTGCMMGIWETSCQFDDDLFAMGTKLTFAVGTTMLLIPEALKPLNDTAWNILGHFYGEEVELRIQKHDYSICDLNTELFMLLHFLSRSLRSNLISDLRNDGISLDNLALEFDKKTNSRLKMHDWILGILGG